MNRLVPHDIRDYVPDRRYPVLADHMARNVFFASSQSTSLSAVAVATTDSFIVTEPMRIRSAQVSTVTGGTITVQVQADGRDLYLDDYRPVSGSTSSEPSDIYVLPVGTVVTTVIEADSGVPSGTATVALETEPYHLLPRRERVVLHGKDRLFVSNRRYAAAVNSGAAPTTEGVALAEAVAPASRALQNQILFTGAQDAQGNKVIGEPGGPPREPPRPGFPGGGPPRPR